MMKKKLKSLFTISLSMLVLITYLYPFMDIKVVAYNKSDDCRVIVSMGDSYSAGEGLGDYYDEKLPESQRKDSQDFLSHRSINSWPGMLNSKSDSSETMANQKDNNWFFVAMSGAITKNIVGDGKALPDPITEEYIEENKYRFKNYLNRYSYTATGINTFKVESCVPIDFQIDVFKNENLKNKEIDYVTMTIGGNDVDFAGIVTTLLHPSCISPNVINDKLSQTYGILPQVQLDLKEVYETVSKKAGEQAHIIVAGYPRLLEPNGKGALISEGEATAVNDAIDVFNKVISTTVNECGDNFSFVSVAEEFAEHAVYSDDPWLYNYEWIIKDDDISDFSFKNGSLVSAASFHPNPKGAQAYAKLVNKEIERLEGNNELTTTIKSQNFISGEILIEIDGKIIYAKNDGIYYKENPTSAENIIASTQKDHASAQNARDLLSDGEIVFFTVNPGASVDNSGVYYQQDEVYSVKVNGENLNKLFKTEGDVKLVTCYDDYLFYLNNHDSNYGYSSTESNYKLNKYNIVTGENVEFSNSDLGISDGDSIGEFASVGTKIYLEAFISGDSYDNCNIIEFDTKSSKANNVLQNAHIVSPSINAQQGVVCFETSGNSDWYIHSVNASGEMTKSGKISSRLTLSQGVISSDGSFALMRSGTNESDFDLYKVNLTTGKVEVIDNGAGCFKNKGACLTYDKKHKENIYVVGPGGTNLKFNGSGYDSVKTEGNNTYLNYWLIDGYFIATQDCSDFSWSKISVVKDEKQEEDLLENNLSSSNTVTTKPTIETPNSTVTSSKVGVVDVWPGQAMECYDSENNIYYFDIPSEYDCFIFSDGNYYYGYDNGIAWQTEDIEFDGNNKMYTPKLNDTSYVNGATICSVECQMKTITNDPRRVYFVAPENWETPSCYCWAS